MSRRLIDADAFIAEEKKLYCKDCDSYHGVRCRACSFNDIWGDLDDYADAYAVEVPRWIPVTERLPHKEWEEATENGMDLYPCLVVERYKGFEPVATKGWYDGKGFINAVSIDVSAVITHWMPLPELPKDGDT